MKNKLSRARNFGHNIRLYIRTPANFETPIFPFTVLMFQSDLYRQKGIKSSIFPANLVFQKVVLL